VIGPGFALRDKYPLVFSPGITAAPPPNGEPAPERVTLLLARAPLREDLARRDQRIGYAHRPRHRWAGNEHSALPNYAKTSSLEACAR
jgi:hypothetical protein